MYKTEHARLYSVKELSAATKKFSQVLGEGVFGTVYKAEHPDGTEGAVKVENRKGLNSSSKVIASDEVAVLLRIHSLPVWNDLLLWRNHMYNTVINAFKNLSDTNPQLHQLGFRDKAWSVNKLASVARKQGLYEVCVNVLNKMYGYMTMEVLVRGLTS
ncbi:unnamed protein product [Calypogeia fissa]